jgi:hypothetical protein
MDARFSSSAATGPGTAAGDADGGGEGKRDAPPEEAEREVDCAACAWPCCADWAAMLLLTLGWESGAGAEVEADADADAADV